MEVRKNLIMYILVVIMAVTLVITGAFAWFASGNKEADSLVIYTGDIDLDFDFKIGIDNNKDGTLDFYEKESGDIVNEESSREEINDYLYKTLNKDTITTQDQLSVGSLLTYKATIHNPNTSLTNALISMSFSDLEEYYYDLMGVSEDEWFDILQKNTGRIMYTLKNIKVKVYTNIGDTEGNLNSGYNKLVASSVTSDTTDNEVTFIDKVNDLGGDNEKNNINVWEISNQEEFVNNILVKVDELVEITFQLECLSTSEIVGGYAEYVEQKINTNNYTSEQIVHINKVVDKELGLLVENTYQGNNVLEFTIKSIYINATQTKKEQR